MTKSFSFVCLVACGIAAAWSARSADSGYADGPWEVRVRAVYLDPANKSDAIPALEVPSDAIHINSKVIPEIDFEYFVAPHWSGELVLKYPQSQTVTVERSALGVGRASRRKYQSGTIAQVRVDPTLFAAGLAYRF